MDNLVIYLVKLMANEKNLVVNVSPGGLGTRAQVRCFLHPATL